MQAVQLLLAAPQLATEAVADAAKAAAAAGHADLAVAVLKALKSRDRNAAEAALANQSLAAVMLRQWEADQELLRQQEARWPALQHLLIGVSAAHQQLRAAAADNKFAIVDTAVPLDAPVMDGAADEAADEAAMLT
jgi:hypothetical protein